MSDYIRPGTQFPKYYQFLESLLRAPISQTAKLAYMVLYDRARLSLKNDWVADGKDLHSLSDCRIERLVRSAGNTVY